jgi:hypothetical protein
MYCSENYSLETMRDALPAIARKVATKESARLMRNGKFLDGTRYDNGRDSKLFPPGHMTTWQADTAEVAYALRRIPSDSHCEK